jgi:hypothetical protein
LLKNKDGYVAIYTLDRNEKETLKEVTEISVDFLTLTDAEKLEKGIKAYGKEALSKIIEDFE